MSENIKNQKYYCNEMRKSMLDKAFFMDKFFEPIETIFDFGCADGTFLAFLKEMFPNYRYIGYDNNPKMIKAAKEAHPDIMFFDSFDAALNSLLPETTLLNLSSVIHEVYSYSSLEEIDEFWDRVFNTGFKYICIRDMTHHEITLGENELIKEYFSLKNDILALPKNGFNEYKALIDKLTGDFLVNGLLSDFVTNFFLKSQYLKSPNWQREINEEYTPLTDTMYKHIISKQSEKYENTYFTTYLLPYLKDLIEKKFDLKIPINSVVTHIKIILKKK